MKKTREDFAVCQKYVPLLREEEHSATESAAQTTVFRPFKSSFSFDIRPVRREQFA